MKWFVTLVLALLVGAMLCPSAWAGWTYTDLTPSGDQAEAYGVSSGGQAGYYSSVSGTNNYPHAALWNGSAASLTDLDPVLGDSSQAFGISGNQEAGAINGHAAVWTSTPGSLVDLNPAGYAGSVAFGTSGSQQVGDSHVTSNSYEHAALWSGTAASYVDLNPSGCDVSEADGVYGGVQVGYIDVLDNGIALAVLWTGSSSSYDLLNPSGCSESLARAVYGNQQGGQADGTATGNQWHAALWSGSASSFVDLNPSGYGSSQIMGMFGGWEAGTVSLPMDYHAYAGVWNGSASSFTNLHSILGAGYNQSGANGVYVSGTDVWVAGWADTTSGYQDAILWHYTAATTPEPSSLLALAGGLLSLGGLLVKRRC